MKLFFRKDNGNLHLIANNGHPDDDVFECIIVPDDLNITKLHTFDDGVTIPVEINRDELNDRLSAYFSSENYISARKYEYPPITDYIDGIVKGDEEQVQAYIDKCLEIKAKYPKGE
jgi:hypothetical protein